MGRKTVIEGMALGVAYCFYGEGCWFRLGDRGAGFHVRDLRRIPELFSERYGYAWGLRVSHFYVRLLGAY